MKTVYNLAHPARFGKDEKLCSKKKMDALFAHGKVSFFYPFKLFYLPSPAEATMDVAPAAFPSVLVSVPKRNLKKAVARNLAKRRIKEAYRLQKLDLLQHFSSPPSTIGIVYVAKENMPFSKILEKMQGLFKKVAAGTSHP